MFIQASFIPLSFMQLFALQTKCVQKSDFTYIYKIQSHPKKICVEAYKEYIIIDFLQSEKELLVEKQLYNQAPTG